MMQGIDSASFEKDEPRLMPADPSIPFFFNLLRAQDCLKFHCSMALWPPQCIKSRQSILA